MQKPTPPLWADRLLEWFCAPHLLEEVQGDLHERFQKNARLFGERSARWDYVINVLRFIRPFALKRKESNNGIPLNSLNMIQNYFKIAFRNLKRDKAFTAINVIGLGIGLATCILITLYVQDEFSYDRYHEKADRIVRLGINLRLNGNQLNGATLGPAVGRDLSNEYPEVLKTTRIRNQGEVFVSHENTSFKEANLLYTDSSFFQVFTIPLLKGNPQTALKEPNTIVITEEIARKYFGNDDPIGKILGLRSEKIPHRVTGVLDDVPENSHFKFDLLASLAGNKGAQEEGWLNNMNFYTYLVLPENYNYKQLEAKIPALADKYIGEDIKKFLGLSLEEFRKKGDDFGIFLQPLTAIHLYSEFRGAELRPGGDIKYVYVLIAIAVFMLLIACVNFMNLSTATATKRFREVGVRKVLGSLKGQLQRQFLTESILLAVLSLLFSLVLVRLFLPLFNSLTGKALTLQLLIEPLVLFGLISGVVLVGLLAGSYPAFYLSSFKPVQVLKGRIAATRNRLNLRSGLVVFQFSISIALIIATLIADSQLRFMHNKAIGFDRDQVLVIQDSYMLKKNERVFKEKVALNPQVIKATISGDIPVGAEGSNNGAIEPKDNMGKVVGSRLFNIDYDYIPALGMRIVHGRNFLKGFSTDSSAVILNETAVQALGWKKDPIGKEIVGRIDNDGTKHFYRVIGVVNDFHFDSMRDKIRPLVMFLGDNSGSIMLKARAGSIPSLLESLKQEWNSFSPDAPFTYSFLDSRFENVYRNEQKISQVLTLFSSMTILIACLGLFGLATYTAVQRAKEIGVRKVLGASVDSIVALLSKDFLKPVLIAFIIASPLAWYGMNRWLQNFAYKTDIEWWIFALAGITAISIALITIAYQAIKAALTNPVKILKNE